MSGTSKTDALDDLQKDLKTNKEVSKPAIDYSQFADMDDDLLLDDFDSDEEDEEEEKGNSDVMKMVKQFHSENPKGNKIDLADDNLEKKNSEQSNKTKINRSMTTKEPTQTLPLGEVVSELDLLRQQLQQANEEIEKYQNFVLRIQRVVNWNNVDMSQAKVHVCFLFASPLLRKIKSGYEQVMLLDYVSEMKNIESNLCNVDYEIKYSKSVATQRNFHSFISDRPIVLHFSGHGLVNSRQNIGNDFAFNEDKGNILLLEDEHGMSDYLYEKDLKNMVDLMGANFEVVFIASCHSEFAGKVFSNAGAKHVICIKGSERISDDAALKFTQVFYDMLFVKQYSV
jgi:hypothetical protein